MNILGLVSGLCGDQNRTQDREMLDLAADPRNRSSLGVQNLADTGDDIEDPKITRYLDVITIPNQLKKDRIARIRNIANILKGVLVVSSVVLAGMIFAGATGGIGIGLVIACLSGAGAVHYYAEKKIDDIENKDEEPPLEAGAATCFRNDGTEKNGAL